MHVHCELATYTHGTLMVHTWYTHGTHMVHTWYTHAWYTQVNQVIPTPSVTVAATLQVKLYTATRGVT